MEADSVFSAVVGSSLDGTKQIIATMISTVDGHMLITYREHPGNSEVQTGEFVWAPEAIAFKGNSGRQGDGDGGLDEGTAQAFMNMLQWKGRV